MGNTIQLPSKTNTKIRNQTKILFISRRTNYSITSKSFVEHRYDGGKTSKSENSIEVFLRFRVLKELNNNTQLVRRRRRRKKNVQIIVIQSDLVIFFSFLFFFWNVFRYVFVLICLSLYIIITWIAWSTWNLEKNKKDPLHSTFVSVCHLHSYSVLDF